MPRIVIAFGSNRGDREGFLCDAIARLRREMTILSVSPVYETDPMYVQDQPPFLNGVLVAETNRGPLATLAVLKQVEREVGRTPAERYGPREIDLDLIAFGPVAYRFLDKGRAKLQVPHPRTPERRFVLAPLADLEPELVLPGLGKVQTLLDACPNPADSVRLYQHAVVPL